MRSEPQKKIIIIEDSKYLSWKSSFKKELKKIKSNSLELDCKNLDLTCIDILELVEIANQYGCKVISFCSTSTKTIISSQSLGYKSQFIIQNDSKHNFKNLQDEKLHPPKTSITIL